MIGVGGFPHDPIHGGVIHRGGGGVTVVLLQRRHLPPMTSMMSGSRRIGGRVGGVHVCGRSNAGINGHRTAKREKGDKAWNDRDAKRIGATKVQLRRGANNTGTNTRRVCDAPTSSFFFR